MRARAACRRAEGSPAYYRLDTVDVGPVGTPHGVAVGADGTLYVADTGGERIVARPRDGVAQTLATTPGRPYGVAVDRSGTIYAALRRMHEVIRVAPDGSSTAFAGTGIAGQSGGGGPAIAAETVAPNGVAVDAQGNVYITQSAITSLFFGLGGPGPEERVRVVDQGGTIRTVAGSGAFGTDGVGGPALAAQLGAPYELATTPDGSVLIGEVGYQRVLRVGSDGILYLLAGRPHVLTGAYSGDGGPAVAARLYGAEGLGTDADGKTFIADMRNSRVRLVDALGSIITIVGTGESSGLPVANGTPGVQASAGCPGLAVGPDGRLYYRDLATGPVRVLTLARY